MKACGQHGFIFVWKSFLKLVPEYLFLLLADVRRCKSGMDLILASLNLETAFSVYKSGFFSKDGMKYFSDRRVYRLHRDILHSLGVIVRDVKRVGKWYKICVFLNILLPI